MPRSDYATCFFFFQKTFVFRKPKHTPRNRRTLADFNLSQISQITQIFIHGYTAAQPRLIITSLPQPITAARPEGSNARAERVALSRGCSEA